MNDKDGGPAFPTTKPLESWGDPNRGMMLRDYFAAQAMTGLIARIINMKDMDEQVLASQAYVVADAMLEQRKLEL
jgi:hypothetical protein